MPLCKPVAVGGVGSLRWRGGSATIKQDQLFCLQQRRYPAPSAVPLSRSWWGDSYRIVITTTGTQLATANDITQIASDWELLHQMLKDNLSPDPEKPMVGQVVKFFEDCWEYSHRKKLENHSAEEEIVMRSVTDLEIGMGSVDIGGGDDEDDSQEATREHDSPFPGIPLHTEGSPVLGRRYSDSRSSAENPSKTDNDSIRKDNRETDRGRAAEATQTFEKGLQDLMESCLSAQRDRYSHTITLILEDLNEIKKYFPTTPGQQGEAEITEVVANLCKLSRLCLECADAVLAKQIEQHEHNHVVDKICKEEGDTLDPHQEMLKKMLRCLDFIKAAGQNTPNMESTLQGS